MDLKQIDLSGKKGILWDLDNTLYAYDPVHKKAYMSCAELAGMKFGMDQNKFDTLWKASRNRVHTDLHGQGASHSRLLYFQKMSESAFGYTDAQFSLEMEENYWSVFLDAMTWREGMEEFVEQCHKLGMKMCIVTDLTCHIQLRKWNKLRLDRFMQFMVSSEEAGIEKPGSYIFQLALEKMNMKAEDVIMIGDSEDKDIQGAVKAGIRAFRLV